MNDDQLTKLAERFCAAPLPDTVCADTCATRHGSGRSGTNLLTVVEARQVLRHVFDNTAAEAVAKFRRDMVLATEDLQPDGTLESLRTCADMLDTWTADCLPANSEGQVDFVRCMIEATVGEIRAYLAAQE